MNTFRSLTLCSVLIAILSLLLVPAAQAVYVFTILQVGDNVVISGSGSLNTSGLGNQGSGNPDFGLIPSAGFVGVGAPALADYYVPLFGPSNFGSGAVYGDVSSSGGDITCIGNDDYYSYLELPTNYVSGSPLAGTCTIDNATFASLGFTPGTYTYTLDDASHATTVDELIVTSVVPEPSTWALLGIGVVTASIVTRRCRRAQG